MRLFKNYRFFNHSLLTLVLSSFGFILIPLNSTGCAAVGVREMEQPDALKILRDLTKDGKLPSESVVLDIEKRFAGTKPGALARLLRARIRFENNDFAGAADILNTNVFKEKTGLGDYALWLRGRAFQAQSNHGEAMKVFAQLATEFPDSMRMRESKVLWANSAIQIGQATQVPNFLGDLNQNHYADALLATAKSYEQQSNQAEAVKFYRQVYFYGAGSEAAKEAEAKLTSFGQDLKPQTQEEITTRAETLYKAGNYSDAVEAVETLLRTFPTGNDPALQLKRVTAYANLRRMNEAQFAFNEIPSTAQEKPEAYYQLATGYAKTRDFAKAREAVSEMKEKFPKSDLTPKTFVAIGTEAASAKNRSEESYFMNFALASFPNAVDVAAAQFDLAWMEHEAGNYAKSSQMLTEHLARYAGKDTANRGIAGYWAARDSERAGKIDEACALYDGTVYRYAANWYGYLALDRLTSLRGRGKCQTPARFPANSLIPKAVENLKIVTVAAETATANELTRAAKSEDLSIVGLFDWAIDELKEAQKTAENSPKINLALAKHYQFKGDNVKAFFALKNSYPDYAQMFPEEMGREEWTIFYPLNNWESIKYWAKQRSLDQYQVAGLIRTESFFKPDVKSHANAYGLMQLLPGTAKMMARKYSPQNSNLSAFDLYNPALNIELGTAYMREQLTKYGRVEYMAAAYNAGPGRVVTWRKTLPFEMDEFVEEIPIKETKGYVQGVVRNTAQYRRLYDDKGNFKSNVGSRPLRGEIDTKSPEQIAQQFPEIEVDRKRNN